ncbi:hypothetical protein CERSUDRAFT_113444 [Gelatoporia subvermispora B]|uniref:Uncharacterized protein n=1 Tax=Ceriporiopsis subvermispora (strain B) TaxID=914234 RepID=M2R180_CERS8|nr:hypothetical protein CERSUDRAFT_113444 [Gelatoporia subvermispora B]
MYSPDYRLDTPPPSSQFRRPWSPDPYDPFPPLPQQVHRAAIPQGYTRQREVSDVSIEALDLADYAMNVSRDDNLYSQHGFRAYDQYPPSPPRLPLASHESMQTPSLASPSLSSAPSLSSSGSPRRAPQRRPFSLPAQTLPYGSSHGHSSYPGRSPAVAPDYEVDISNFPSFSQAWYDPEKPRMPGALSSAGHGSYEATMSPFDPAYPTHAYNASPYPDFPPHSPPPSYPFPHSQDGLSKSSRDPNLVPWGTDLAESDAPIDPEMKEERLRMLEREFGGKQRQDNDNAETAVGSVDHTGKLITEGPKKRLAVRCVEVLLALTACISSIYAALVIKPPTPAPPANKLPAYLLYVLSALTFLAVTFVFFLYPCCCGRRRPAQETPFSQGPGGMMVLPVPNMPGKGKPRKNKKGKQDSQGVQVNLIVDPSMFGGDRESRSGEWDEADDEDPEAPPGSYTSSRTRRPPRRRGIFAGLAMEAQWKAARKTLKWGMAFDVVSMVIWGTEFVVILMGKRCPVGEFEGWCDAYNVASASAFLICLAFGFSIFFDIKDLHQSSASPRTRT